LAWGNSALWLVKIGTDAAILLLDQHTLLILLTIAHLGATAQFACLGRTVDPMHLLSQQMVGIEKRVICALGDDQAIVSEILAHHKPGRFIGAFDAANTQPLALAKGVIHQARVLADNHSLGCDDFAGLGG